MLGSELDTALREAMAEMLRETCGVKDVAEVTRWGQYTWSAGRCDTCYHSEVRVKIRYRTTGGEEGAYDYVGDLGVLIRALTD